MSPATAVAAVRGGYGLLLALRPGTAGRLLAGRPVDPLERRVLQVLGARHLVQAGLIGYRPGLARAGALVDVAHAASLAALAAVDGRRRRYALLDLAVAGALAAGTAAAAGVLRPR